MTTAYLDQEPIIEQLQRQLRDVFSVNSFTVLKPRGGNRARFQRPAANNANPLMTEPAQTGCEAIAFRGKLLTDSDAAFSAIRPRFESLGFTPTLERDHDQDVVTALPGIIQVRESNPLVNLILFLVTVVTTFLTGALNQSGFNPIDGVFFSVSMLTILGAHELGHYFVARYYKAPVTLPYFIPMPPLISPIGTLGAVIRLKAPFVNRKSLFDVGIAGPLAGLVFAVPILFIGLAMSPVGTCPVPGQCFQEGNSLFYAFAKYVVFGRFLPANGIDVQLSPVAWAGWVGLFVTALNLLPAGQLDGGHVTFALLGRNARWLGWATIVILAILSLPLGSLYPGYQGWLIWVALIYLTGVDHPIPLNDISDLGLGRTLLGIGAWLIFILLFTPLPFSISS